MIPRHDFPLNYQPVAYVISIHINNIICTDVRNIDDYIIDIHIQNLVLTFGDRAVQCIIQDLFPEYYDKFFNSYRKVS